MDRTEAQRNLLPDGIRDTQADHVLIEFKYSQSKRPFSGPVLQTLILEGEKAETGTASYCYYQL
jgi:hypothetical protein